MGGDNLVIVTYDLVLADTSGPVIPANGDLTNTATLSNYASTEGGADFTPTDLTDDASVTSRLPGLTKTIVATSESHTNNALGIERVAIGEIIRYRYVAEIPEGTYNDFEIVDLLPAGLTYVNDGTATVAFVSDSDSITSSDNGALLVGLGNTPFVAGNETNIAGIAPTVSLTDANVGSTSSNDVDVNNYTAGADPRFKFGDLVNTDNDANKEYVVVEFNALVNNNAASPNDRGASLYNDGQIAANGATLFDISSGNRPRVIVAEPSITNVNKTADLANADAGDTVTYTVTFGSSNSSVNHTTAFDVRLLDDLGVPGYLTLTGVTVTSLPGTTTVTDNSAGNVVNLVFDQLQPGESVTVQYTATVNDNAPIGQTLVNTADVTYTSLPGDFGTIGNPTGSDLQSLNGLNTGNTTYNTVSGAASGERDGSNTGPNDYRDSDSDSIVIDSLAPIKSIVATSEASTLGSNVAIGEIVRYRIEVRVPENDSLSDVQIVDRLPLGTTFLDDGTATVAFVSSVSGNLSSSTLSDPSLDQVGDQTTLAGITPTFVLPDAAVSVTAVGDSDAYGSGTDVRFKLGDMVNDDRDGNGEFIVIEFNAVVDNSVAADNRSGDILSNTVDAIVAGATSGSSPAVVLTVVEPSITNVNKTGDIATADAGDTVTYTVTFANASGPNVSTAFDVRLLDDLDIPGFLTLTGVSVTSVPGTTTVTDNSVGNVVDLVFDQLQAGESVTVQYTATVDANAPIGQTLVNTANVTYTSTPGDFGTIVNATGSDLQSLDGVNTGDIIYDATSGAESGERDGSNTGPNSYLDNDAYTLTVDSPIPTKSIQATSEASTSGSTVAIGEIVRYRLQVRIPENDTLSDVQLVNYLPVGTTFLNDGTAALAFVTSSTGNLTSSTLMGPTLSQVGDETSLAGIAPAFLLPDTAISTDAVANNDVYTTGTAVRFKLGDLVNADRDSNGEFVVIEFNALVDNSNAANNQAGDTLSNSFDVVIAGTTLGSSAAAVATVAEPVIVDVNKSITTPGVDAGDAVTYRVTFSNSGTATAFDVNVLDLLDATYLDLDTGSITFASTGVVNGVVNNSSEPGNRVEFQIGEMGVGATVTIEYTAQLTQAFNDDVSNTVDVTYTSLPGTGTPVGPGNTTGSATPGVSGAADGERDGSGAGLNDYADQSSATQPFPAPSISKTIVSTSLPDTPTDDVAIGETITYHITVTLPEGVTNSVVITDLAQANGLGVLEIVSAQILPLGGNISTTNSSVTLQNNSGADALNDTVIVDLGDVTNLFDNITNTDDQVLVEVVARVANDPRNAAGDSLVNSASLAYAAGSDVTDTLTVDVVEPVLDLTKNIVQTQADAGDTVTIVLTVSNTGTAPAYDVTVQDVISATDFDRSTLNFGVAGTNYPSDFAVAYNSGTGLLEYSGGSIAAGASATFQFTVDLADTVAPGAVITNTANLTDANTLPGPDPNERTLPPDADNDSLTIRTNSLAGFVFDDADNDGIFDVGESGILNAQVQLIGTDHLGNSVNQFVSTLADGSYSFLNLRPGSYTLVETQPGGFLDGLDTAGSQGGSTAVNDVILSISLPTGVETNGVNNNFAELAPASLAGSVYHDLDNDGVRDGGEVGIAGISLRLQGTDDLGATIDRTTTTAGDGTYSFANLRPGVYSITETQPITFLDGVDSDGSLANGDTSTNDVIASIDVVPGDTGVSYNFGEIAPSRLSGYVYHDANNDGDRSGDNGLSGITIRLTGVDDLGNSISVDRITNAAGFYEFLDLRPSDAAGYTIIELVQPAGYLDGVDTIGTPGGSTAINDRFTNVVVVSNTNGVENNFGELLPATLSGKVFNDRDNDGVVDAGESGIAGVSVRLTGVDDLGNLIDVTLATDSNGDYQFTGLRPSDANGYAITETQPASYNDGIDTDGSLANGDTTLNDAIRSINVGSGDAGAGYNFGELGATISGLVFIDDDRDGTLDAGEPTRLGGIVIELYDPTGTTLLGSTTTLLDGSYRFDHLPAGDYQIREVQPTGYSSTSSNTLNVTLPLTGLSNQNFGEALWDIGDRVWFDADGDGVQDGGEPNLVGVQVTLLYAGADNTFGTGDDVVRTDITDSSGLYGFAELLNGDYRISIDTGDLPAGSVQTFELDGVGLGDLNNRSDITLNGADRFDVNFGYAGALSLGDRLWHDLNGDGVQDVGEPGIAGVNMTLLFAGADGVFGSSDDFSLTTTTDGAGLYGFSNLPQGPYRLTYDAGDLPSGISVPTAEVDDVSPAIDGVSQLVLSSDRTDVDFGFTGALSLGDRLWLDLNGDGVQDPGEPGLANVDVTMLFAGPNGVFGDADDAVYTTRTSDAGDYLFTLLGDGDYQVSYDAGDLPGGLTPTFEFDGSTNNQADVTLNGVSELNVNFGFTGSGTIGDFVWLDTDGDGVQDPSNEPGLAGITVDLLFAGADGVFGNADDIALSTTTDANGGYSFNNLPAGDFRVTADAADPDLPGGAVAVSGPESIAGTAAATLITGQTRNDLDFGFTGSHTVGDYVWLDLDGNGLQGPSEPAIPAATLTLTYAGQDGVFGNSDDVTLTTNTDANGLYSFGGLLDGEYRVAVNTATIPAGVTQTAEQNDGVDLLANTAEFAISGGDRNDIDFGYTGARALGDLVWYDVNNDGLRDAGEPGLNGVNISLFFAGADGVFGNADDITLSDITDANGIYGFDHLPTGEYRVAINAADIPSGLSATLETDDTAPALDGIARITIGAVDRLDADFAFTGDYQIGDRLWYDTNGDGGQDLLNEPGLGGVRVNLTFAGQDNLFGTSDDVVRQATTDANGDYLFDNIADGAHRVTVNPSDLPLGVSGTFEVDGSIDQVANFLVNGSDRMDVDFGYQATGSLSDYVWFDEDADGVQDPAEVGLPGVQVLLVFGGRDGVFGTLDDFSMTTTTDQNGLYAFNNLPAGDFRIDVTGEPLGMTSTYETDDGVNSLPGIAEVGLTVGESRDDIDFGFTGTGSIGDTVYYDADANGVQDAGEPGLPLVTVALDIDFNGDTIVDHTLITTTDANGGYSFNQLPAGDYTVRVTQPAGSAPTVDADGLGTPNQSSLTLAGGENNVDQDFGYTGTGSLGDTVFFDVNGDGVLDAGDRGLPGVEVSIEIDVNGDTVVDYTRTAITDVNGNYLFDRLIPGDYRVAVNTATLPGGMAGNPTFDADGGNDHQSLVTLGAGAVNLDQDFGYTAIGSIGDRVWLDVNADGLQDPNEVGLANVDVQLIWYGVDGVLGTLDDEIFNTTTDADGLYAFERLPAGLYDVDVDQSTAPLVTLLTTGNDPQTVNLNIDENYVERRLRLRRAGFDWRLRVVRRGWRWRLQPRRRSSLSRSGRRVDRRR